MKKQPCPAKTALHPGLKHPIVPRYAIAHYYTKIHTLGWRFKRLMVHATPTDVY